MATFLSFFLCVALCILCRESFSLENPSCRGPAELEKAIASQPSAGAYNALGAYFAQRSQFSCAISAFEKALQLDTNSWETRYNLGLAFMQKGDSKRAAKELQGVVAQKPDLLNAHNALASVLQDVGELDAAANEFKAALKIDPRSVYALRNLGQVLMSQKRFGVAITYLKQ